MGFFDFGKRKKTQAVGVAEQDNLGNWFQYFDQFASSLNNDKLITYKESIAYSLACNIAEVFIPIDAIADRAASIPYIIYNKRTDEIVELSGNLQKLVENPNPLDRQSDLVYKNVFNRLASGSNYIYTKTAESIKNPTIDNISNIWSLQPDVTKAVLKKQIANPFLMKSKADFIEKYKTFFLVNIEIDPRYIVHRTSLGINEKGYAPSPLSRVERNINNVLAVYQARYNVYAKNGNGGILSADKQSKGLGIEQAIEDPIKRDDIVKDLNNRNGVTGNKNFIGISSIPLKFLKTLGTISELQPFEETEENAIKIAGAFGVNKELIPRKGSSTFTNQKDAEKGLWQNVVKSICWDEAKDLTKAYYLPEEWEFRPDFSGVECLQEDKKTSYETDGVYLDNLIKIQTNNLDINEEMQERYGEAKTTD